MFSQMFKTAEICETCRLAQQTLDGWIKRRWVVPTYVGSLGRSNPHRFSPQQAIGLAYAASMVEEFGRLTGAGVREMMALWEKMPNALVREWCAKQLSAHDEELMAQRAAERKLNKFPIPAEWSDGRVVAVLNAIRARLLESPGDPLTKRELRLSAARQSAEG